MQEAIDPPQAQPREAIDNLEALVREYHQPVTRLAYRLLGWRGDVEDLVHDVFLAAFKQRHRFRGDSSAWTWLAAIAINQCRSHRRRQVRRFRWLRIRNRPDHAARSSEQVERDETAERVRDAVAKLRIRDRELIVLHYLEELSTDQICAITGANMKTIHVRLHRARQRLRALLEDKND